MGNNGGILRRLTITIGVRVVVDDRPQALSFEQPLVAGMNNLTFGVPILATPADQTFARFRLSSAGGLFVTDFIGPAPDGEVEDYEVQIETVQNFPSTT